MPLKGAYYQASQRQRQRQHRHGYFRLTDAFFCDKNRIRKFGKEEHLVKCVTKTVEESIKKAAETKQDEAILLKIQDIDLVAKEVHYHAFCRKNYTRSVERHDVPKDGENESHAAMEAAHKAAFDKLCEHVNTSIISGENVERMSMLRERYLTYILQNSPECYNPDYKTDKLNTKLVKRFGSSIQFWQPNYRSEFVYSSDIKRVKQLKWHLKRRLLNPRDLKRQHPF